MITACRRGVEMLGIGSFAPERVVTNDELATRIETSDEWIASRTGIRERRIASDAESAAERSYAAAAFTSRFSFDQRSAAFDHASAAWP